MALAATRVRPRAVEAVASSSSRFPHGGDGHGDAALRRRRGVQDRPALRRPGAARCSPPGGSRGGGPRSCRCAWTRSTQPPRPCAPTAPCTVSGGPTSSPVRGTSSRIEVKLAVVSSFDTRLRKLLNDLNVSDMFDAIVVSSEVGYHKPAPEIFKIALDQIGVEVSKAVHVGDDETADKAGADAIGLQCWLRGEDVKTFSEIYLE